MAFAARRSAMASSIDNVIRFPDGARGSVADFDRSRILVEARDLMAHKLREAFRALLPGVEEVLLGLGDVADERDARQRYYGTKDVLHDNAGRLEGLLAANWLSLFEQKGRAADKAKTVNAVSDPDELQLVEFGAMDEELAVKAIGSRLRDGCEDGLFAAGRRLAFLFGQQENDTPLPIADLIAQALDGAFEDIGLDSSARLDVLRSLEPHAVEHFGPAIHDLNSFLIGRGVLPRLRRSFSRAPAARKPPTESDQSVDVFNLLQKLVAAQSTTTAGSGFAGTGGAGGGDGGSGGDVTAGGGSGAGVSANMVVAMQQIMTSLDALQRVAPVQVASVPSTNVLREFRSSDTGQSLGYLDAVTVDIVATLFDFIFDDASVADPIKALVARLQIPVLKVAMLDKTFFSSKSHPARRLLDGVSRAAARCGPEAGHDDPLYKRIAEIVDRLQNEFAQDTGLFDTLCVDLNEFLDGQEADADARAARAAPLVAEQERRELAHLAVDDALAGWLAMPLPSAVSDLLAHEWHGLLVRHYLANDDAAWGTAMSTVADLVASVQPQTQPHGRKQLASRLPTLVRRIHDGLDSLKVADERRLALIDALFSLHAAVLRGAAPVVTDAWPSAPKAEVAPAKIACEHIEEGETQLERITLDDDGGTASFEASDGAQDQVAGLQRGDWIEFVNAESGRLRYRLSWISPQRGILLFTNPQSPRAISVSPDALILQIERGEAILVPAEPMFDRAVNRAIETLRAA
jgi:hypothetical protein